LDFLEKTGIMVVAMPASRATGEFTEALNGIGAASFIRFSNDLREIRGMLEIGVMGIYTQFVTLDMLYMAEEELEYKELVLRQEQKRIDFIEFVNGLQEDIGENYIRIINLGNISEDTEDEEDIDDVANAFLTLINIESYQNYLTSDGYLYIDGYQYNHTMDENVITVIIYSKATRRIEQAVALDPDNHFMMSDINLQRENNRRYFMEYMYNLLQEDFMIFMSVRAEATSDLDEGMLEKLASLGLTESLNGRYRYSYAAIIKGDTVIFESLSDEQIEFTDLFDRNLIELSSAGWAVGDMSSIRINGIEHSRNGRGINIVTFNTRTGMVEDSVVFDTHFEIHASR